MSVNNQMIKLLISGALYFSKTESLQDSKELHIRQIPNLCGDNICICTFQYLYLCCAIVVLSRYLSSACSAW